jgi:hypothetical protein
MYSKITLGLILIPFLLFAQWPGGWYRVFWDDLDKTVQDSILSAYTTSGSAYADSVTHDGRHVLGDSLITDDEGDARFEPLDANITKDDVAETITSKWTFSDTLDFDDAHWSTGNVRYVPIGADIQTYIDVADSGNTLLLGSGLYTLTDTLEIDKPLNIIGQGRSGFVTTPITPTQGTLIGSSTANLVAFHLNSSNIRISNLSINLTGAASKGISTANNLVGLVFNDVDIIVNSTGAVYGLELLGSNVVMRDLTFYVSSSDNTSSGAFVFNNSSTTQNIVVDAYNVTGTAVGGATYAYSFAAWNINDANTITVNLSNSVCRGLEGTPLDVGVACVSTTTNNATVNAQFCTIDGGDYDFYQTGTNVLNVEGSLLKNNTIFGTVVFRSTIGSQNISVSDSGFIDTLTVGGAVNLPADQITTLEVLDSTLGGIDIATGSLNGWSMDLDFPGNGLYFETVDAVTKLMHIRTGDGLAISSDSIVADPDKFSIETNASSKKLQGNAVYAFMYITDTAEVTITTAGTYYDLTPWTGASSSNFFSWGGEPPTGYIVVDSAGVYDISLNTSYYGTASAVGEVYIFLNSVRQPEIGFLRKLGLSGDVGSVSCRGILTLSAGDSLEWKATSDDDADVLNFTRTQFNIILIGR